VVALANPPGSVEGARDLVRDLKELPAAAPIAEALDVNERLISLAGYVDLYRAGRASPQAWEQRIGSILEAERRMAHALDGPEPSSVWKEIPAWAIDWDELLRTLNRCWQTPECDVRIEKAKGDLSPLRLRRLLLEARVYGGARRRLARAFLGIQTRSSLIRAKVAWNETEALRHLGLVSAVAAVVRAETGRYPKDLATMTFPGVDPMAVPSGYSFRYQASTDGMRFAYVAVPESYGSTGVRAFCADSSGRLVSHPAEKPLALLGDLCDPSARVLAERSRAEVAR
jgi:hypothetical protein